MVYLIFAINMIKTHTKQIFFYDSNFIYSKTNFDNYKSKNILLSLKQSNDRLLVGKRSEIKSPVVAELSIRGPEFLASTINHLQRSLQSIVKCLKLKVFEVQSLK